MAMSHKLLCWMDTGIFTATILFSVGFKYDEIVDICKKKKATGWDLALEDDKKLIDGGNAFALKRIVEHIKTGKKITYYYIIFTKPFDFSDWSMSKLAHECLHICQFMLPDFLDREKEHECEAYFHTYLMNECLKRMRKKP